MKFTVKVVPHSMQRYNTVGDWQFSTDGTLHIRVSDYGDWRMVWAVAVHELVETYLCQRAGITEAMVDEFDLAYDENRTPDDTSEPGDNPNAPYYKQHQIATKVEKLVCAVLLVSWKAYLTRTDELMMSYSTPS